MSAKAEPLTERTFGLIFAGLFAGIFGVVWLVFGKTVTALPVLAAVLVLLALVKPLILLPFNRTWTWIVNKLATVNNYVVLGVVYYLLITPFGCLMRLAGRDPMARRRRPEAATYFTPVGRRSSPETLPDMF